MAKLEMSIEDLQRLLDEQKDVIAKHMTRNLSVYHWWGKTDVDSTKATAELKKEVHGAGYPMEFNTLKKFVK